MKAAVEAGDLDGFMATLSPDVVLRSPISELAKFQGAAEMRELMRAVFDTIEDIRYYEESTFKIGQTGAGRGREH
jgi:hypothetical protein